VENEGDEVGAEPRFDYDGWFGTKSSVEDVGFEDGVGVCRLRFEFSCVDSWSFF